jgi:hypothetical protein
VDPVVVCDGEQPAPKVDDGCDQSDAECNIEIAPPPVSPPVTVIPPSPPASIVVGSSAPRPAPSDPPAGSPPTPPSYDSGGGNDFNGAYVVPTFTTNAGFSFGGTVTVTQIKAKPVIEPAPPPVAPVTNIDLTDVNKYLGGLGINLNDIKLN